MKEYSSCKSAIQSCIENKSFAVAHLYNDERPMDMHIMTAMKSTTRFPAETVSDR
mgnify:CR=1 FL=1